MTSILVLCTFQHQCLVAVLGSIIVKQISVLCSLTSIIL